MKPSNTTIQSSERQPVSWNSLLPLFLAAALCFAPAFSLVWAAPPAAAKQNVQQSDPDAVAPGQIGNTGYMVPIPEIRMKSIIGNQPPKKAQPEAPPPKERPAVEEPAAPESSDSPGNEAEFDEPPPPVESPAVAPEKKREIPAETREVAPEADRATRLPFDPAYRATPNRTREVGPPPARSVPERTIESPLASPPVAPEETIEAPPLKKEVLKGKVAVTLPNMLEAAPVKGSVKTNPIDRMTIQREDDSADGISFAQRREPEAMPAEPEKPPVQTANVSKPEPPVSEPQNVDSPAPQPEPDVVEETPRPEEQPAVEQTTPPPTRIASPLESDALGSRDVKDYLTQTSPILEELSLLMTRAPSLAIADFDPSDPNTVIFPKEIYVKIDSMKRALQVLDSKAFAIIPPTKYASFHSVIRESIIQTYQACDAMINYFNERSDENLQKVHDHLMKARELVQKTHLAQG